MNVVILGASGKVGRYLYKEILKNNLLPQTKHLFLQFNSNKIEAPQINTTKKIDLLEMNILSVKSIKRFLEKLPQKIDILINLLSIFDETPYQTTNKRIRITIKANFLNQVSLLSKILPRVIGGTVIQFFDYCVKKPFSGKYFWYSVSKNAIYIFYKHFEDFAKASGQNYRLIYFLPKYVKETDYEKIKDIINTFSQSNPSSVEVYEIYTFF
ncbi:MAG: hypothetical protein ABDH28_06375 [Brevinematia bacterium]